MRRKTVRWGLGVGVVLVAASGCASLLGDFTANGEATGDDGGLPQTDGAPSTTDGTVGTGDGAGGDATTTGDDGSSTGDDGPTTNDTGTDSAVPLAHCAFSLPNPVLIESLEASPVHFYNSSPILSSLGDSVVQILMPNENGQYTLFWVRPNNPNNVVEGEYSQPLGDNGGQVLSAQRIDGGFAMMREFGSFIGGNSFGLTIFEDTDQPGNAPSGGAILSGTIPNFNNLSASFTQIGANDFTWGATAVTPDAGSNTALYAGRSYPDGGLILGVVNSNVVHGNTPFVIHDGARTRFYLSSDPTSGNARAYSVPDTLLALDAGVPGRSLGVPDGGLTTLMIAATEATGGSEFALIDVDTSTGLSGTFKTGLVPSANLDTFTSATLPLGTHFGSGSDLPVNKGSAIWSNDEFGMIGLGFPPAATGGLNFIWMDAQGHLRANVGSADALLTGHRQIDGVGLALAQKIGAGFVSWHVVWSEQSAGADGGLHDALYYDTLTCD